MFKNIILIGFMGAGKSCLGKMLAQNLSFTFVDTDEEISQKMGLAIPEIFKKKGEAFFRKIEQKVILQFIFQKKIVLSTGGGAASALIKYKDRLQTAWVVYIKWKFTDLWPRLQSLTDRPLLSALNKRELETLFNERHRLYSSIANQKIDGSLPLEQASKLVCQKFRESGIT
jgi:shikimate kinase